MRARRGGAVLYCGLQAQAARLRRISRRTARDLPFLSAGGTADASRRGRCRVLMLALVICCILQKFTNSTAFACLCQLGSQGPLSLQLLYCRVYTLANMEHGRTRQSRSVVGLNRGTSSAIQSPYQFRPEGSARLCSSSGFWSVRKPPILPLNCSFVSNSSPTSSPTSLPRVALDWTRFRGGVGRWSHGRALLICTCPHGAPPHVPGVTRARRPRSGWRIRGGTARGLGQSEARRLRRGAASSPHR